MALRTAFVVVVAAVGVGALLLMVRRHAEPPAEPPAKKPPAPPSLYCEFYDFMHASVVMSYDFAVASRNGKPSLVERAEVDADKIRVTFTDAERPIWSSATEDGVLTATSPDGETRIVLYGLKPKAPGVFWIEAGVRSNRFRNLEGKCRQAHLDTPAG